MALLDGPLREASRVLVTTLGAPATLRRTTKGTYNPRTGDEAGEQITDETVKITPPSAFSRMEIDWTAPAGRFDAILRDDLKVYMAAKGLTLDPPSSVTDVLIFNGTEYKIVAVRPDYSGAQAVGYLLQLRK